MFLYSESCVRHLKNLGVKYKNEGYFSIFYVMLCKGVRYDFKCWYIDFTLFCVQYFRSRWLPKIEFTGLQLCNNSCVLE